MVGKLTGVVLLLCCLVCVAEADASLVTIDNGIGEGYLYGREREMRDYIVLKNDPKGELTDQFTVCNSLFVDYVTSTELFLALYKENGEHWLSYFMKEIRNVDDFTEQITLIANDKHTFFWRSGIAVKPHSCTMLALDLTLSVGS